MNPPNISTLLSFIDGKISEEKAKKIATFIDANPEYNRIIAALMMLKQRFNSNQEILDFLKNKKQDFMRKNFGED